MNWRVTYQEDEKEKQRIVSATSSNDALRQFKKVVPYREGRLILAIRKELEG